LEKRQGFKIASPEEVAFHKGFIGIPEMERAIERLGRSDYGRYLRRIIESTFFIEWDKDKLAQLATRLRESILLCLRKPPKAARPNSTAPRLEAETTSSRRRGSVISGILRAEPTLK
jgi:hypothetical protein